MYIYLIPGKESEMFLNNEETLSYSDWDAQSQISDPDDLKLFTRWLCDVELFQEIFIVKGYTRELGFQDGAI